MSKILVLFYYSTCGHTATMAQAVTEGARFQGRHVAFIAAKLAA